MESVNRFKGERAVNFVISHASEKYVVTARLSNTRVCNNSVRTSKETRHFSIIKNVWLTLLPVYSGNHTKP